MQKAEREATYPADEAAHAAAVEELAGASAAAQENVDGLNVQLRELAAQREDVKAKVAALQRKAEHIEEIVTEAEPRTRCVGGEEERASRWMCICVQLVPGSDTARHAPLPSLLIVTPSMRCPRVAVRP